MSVLWTIIGMVVLLLTAVDVFLTILGGHTAGPVTKGWSALLWRGLLVLHERRPAHRVLTLVGPMIVLLTVLIWYGGLVVGAGLVFAAHPGSVVSSSTRLPAATVQLFYFVPVTVSGLGYGDLVPSDWPWTALATTVSLAGAIVLTCSLSYIISVVGAAIRRRTYALSVFGLGPGPSQIIPHLRFDQARESMHDYLATVASSLTETAEQQLTYPVLGYFHTVRAEASPAMATLILADTAYLLRHCPVEQRPGPGLGALLDSAVAGFVTVKHVSSTSDYEQGEHAAEMTAQATSLGLDTGPRSDFAVGLDEYLQRRDDLLAACRDDGWGPAVQH